MVTVEQSPRLRAKIIYNPESGDKQQKRTAAIQAAQRLRGKYEWLVDIEPTRYSGHAKELAREAALEDVNVVFSMGGDGTANEIARGLLWSNTALAILPEGTVNIGAREIKVPSDTVDAIDAYVHGSVHSMDVGAIATRDKEGTTYGNIFLFIADLGQVGRTINSIHKPGKEREKNGIKAHLWEGIKQISHADTPPAVIKIDDEEDIAVEHLVQIFVHNTPDLSFIRDVRSDAKCDDRQLAITIFYGRYENPSRNILSLTNNLTGKLIGVRRPASNEIQGQGERFIITSERPLYGDVDGEPLDSGVEREIFVMPDSLSILVPKSEGVEIFSRPGTPLIPSTVR